MALQRRAHQWSAHTVEQAAIVLHNQARQPGDREGIDWVPWERLPEWARKEYQKQAEEVLACAHPVTVIVSSDVQKLTQEYRPTMDPEVLHAWAQDIITTLR